jgi:hypothetical protein
MGNGATKGRLGVSPLYIYVNPLVIASGFGKLLDALLADGQPIAYMGFGANFALQVSESRL